MMTTKSLMRCLWGIVLFAMIPACSNLNRVSDLASPVQQAGDSQKSILGQAAQEVDQHCTVIYAADDQVALGGNNEDNYSAPLTHIWFIPPEEGRYGMALVGYDNFLNPEGAVNDHGLFFDGLAVRDMDVPLREGTVPYEGSAIMKIMTECATVDCALKFFQTYSLAGHWNGQWLLGDSRGSSVIIEPLAVVRKDGPFQVATNFLQSEVPPAYRTDRRYVDATYMLQNADHFTVDLFRDTLKVAHQQYAGDANNPPLHTQYSTIYDLRKGLIYLYYFHDFENVVRFDLKQELAKGIHSYEIPSLFPPSAVAQEIEGKYPARVADLPRSAADPALLRQYAGNYRIEAQKSYLDGKVYVKSAQGRLFLRNAWMPWVEAIPQPGGEFVYQFMDAQNNAHQLNISFVKEASGQGTQMELGMDGSPTMPAEKAPPDPIQVAGLGLFVILALCLAGLGIKAFRSKA